MSMDKVKSLIKRVCRAMGLGKKGNSSLTPAEHHPSAVTAFENTEGQSQHPIGHCERDSTAELDFLHKTTVTVPGDTGKQDQDSITQQKACKYFSSKYVKQ
ncbi:hypothetical protein K435DRAFT_862340 [Dendrothele bispora CBS 962.96]|uniref:Uncharacterized protein n=1 Tax=Dendrothele bispora (strain CBS 962.96) TaxID=1314807 RepID=A0A4S8LST9_DENBC|nr:hypothetical protein K435DRAFT_862340 [Dendrothele bispora CBS 962.96]